MVIYVNICILIWNNIFSILPSLNPHLLENPLMNFHNLDLQKWNSYQISSYLQQPPSHLQLQPWSIKLFDVTVNLYNEHRRCQVIQKVYRFYTHLCSSSFHSPYMSKSINHSKVLSHNHFNQEQQYQRPQQVHPQDQRHLCMHFLWCIPLSTINALLNFM